MFYGNNYLDVQNWGWCFQMFFKSFTKCPWWLSYILLITLNPPTMVTVNDTVLIVHNIFNLWWHQDVFKCLSPLKCTVAPCFPHMFLNFYLCLVHMVSQCGIFLTGYLDVGVCFFFSFLFFSCCCRNIFLIAHLEYLHRPSTSSRWFNSLLSDCGVEQMVCALCVKVLITLYLADKLWLPSHGRYKSVWVGFLYTPMVKVPSVSGVMIISKQGWNHHPWIPQQ